MEHSINPNNGGFDYPYIKASTTGNIDMANCTATGFRLLTSNEWSLRRDARSDTTNTVSGYVNPYFTKGNSLSGSYTFFDDISDTNPVNGVVDGKDAK